MVEFELISLAVGVALAVVVIALVVLLVNPIALYCQLLMLLCPPHQGGLNNTVTSLRNPIQQHRNS